MGCLLVVYLFWCLAGLLDFYLILMVLIVCLVVVVCHFVLCLVVYLLTNFAVWWFDNVFAGFGVIGCLLDDCWLFVDFTVECFGCYCG